MPKVAVRLIRPVLFATLVVSSTIAFAAAPQRTFVASNGNDANPCSITLPCRGFAAAIAAVAGGGEIIVLDSAGYGVVTITKSVSIIAPPGVYAGITAMSPATDGISIDGSAILVVLRGLTINGQGASFGINFIQGSKLTVEACQISAFAIHGVYANAPNSVVVVRNTVIRDNAFGGFVADGLINASVDGVHIHRHSLGGVLAANGARVTVANSVLTNNGEAGVAANALFTTTTDVMVTHTIIAGNTYGFKVSAGGGATARLVSDNNAINDVTLGAFFFNNFGGTETIYTSGTNAVSSNSPVTLDGVLTPIGQH